MENHHFSWENPLYIAIFNSKLLVHLLVHQLVHQRVPNFKIFQVSLSLGPSQQVKSVDDLHPLAALASEAPEVAVPPETGQTDRGADDSMA